MRYLFFDTAVNGYYTLTVLKKELPSFLPLIGKEENISDDVAPFIFEIKQEKLTQFLSTEHISCKEIIFLESKETLETIQTYFSRFVVQTINGREFYFRFWSASVFKKYIVTCDTKQLAEFFGIVDKFICEDSEATAVSYSFDGRKLVAEKATNYLASNGNTSLPQKENAVNNEEENMTEVSSKRKQPRKFFS